MTKLVLLMGLSAILLIVAADDKKAKCATVTLQPATKDDKFKGTVTFTQQDDVIRIEGEISGIAPGKHGFHIHEKADLSDACKAAGPHFNPEAKKHGAPDSAERHVGDLGNIEADADGRAVFNFTDKVIALSGTHNILDRAVVLHEKADDLGLGGDEESTKTGNAGSRIACGVVKENNASIAASSLILMLLASFSIFTV